MALTYDRPEADKLKGPMRFNPVASAVFVLLVVGLAGSARPLAAQSLADLSRQEEDRRKNVKEPAKVITHQDLSAVPPSGVPPAPAADAKTSEAAKDASKDADKDTAKDSKEPVKDQKYWSSRMKQLQTQLDRDQSFSGALQTQINSLSADFVSRDDPAQKAVIEQNRQKALAELNSLKDAIVKDKKAIDDLNEEARRAGVPPGWLR